MIGKNSSETLLPEKEDFYSYLSMVDITDADCTDAKIVCKDFEVNNLGEYPYLHIQRDIFLLA